MQRSYTGPANSIMLLSLLWSVLIREGNVVFNDIGAGDGNVELASGEAVLLADDFRNFRELGGNHCFIVATAPQGSAIRASFRTSSQFLEGEVDK
jgi:hypothetical protein